VAKPAHLVAPSANPYTAASTSALQEEKQDEELERAATRRAKPTLRFIQKGKYVQQAEALRQEAKMEALRARIAEASKKAGLSSEFEVLERNIKVTTSVIFAITFGCSSSSRVCTAPTTSGCRMVGCTTAQEQVIRRPGRPIESSYIDGPQLDHALRTASDSSASAMGRSRGVGAAADADEKSALSAAFADFYHWWGN
jgi:hypothetical protein